MFKAVQMSIVVLSLISGAAYATEQNLPTTEVSVTPYADTSTSVPVVRNHGLFLGIYDDFEFNQSESVDSDGNDGGIEYDRVGYLNYSPITNGLSPVVGVNFGDIKGFNLGGGYGLEYYSVKLKPYFTVSTFDVDNYFTNDAEIGASIGVQFALPVGLAVDVGVSAPELVDFVESDTERSAFAGIGYRF